MKAFFKKSWNSGYKKLFVSNKKYSWKPLQLTGRMKDRISRLEDKVDIRKKTYEYRKDYEETWIESVTIKIPNLWNMGIEEGEEERIKGIYKTYSTK
jgi:hypothetical protein